MISPVPAISVMIASRGIRRRGWSRFLSPKTLNLMKLSASINSLEKAQSFADDCQTRINSGKSLSENEQLLFDIAIEEGIVPFQPEAFGKLP